MRTRHDVYFEDKFLDKKKLNVNSFHNFGIPTYLLAKCLMPIGLDKSKNVEFFKHNKLKIFGTMFHPEREKKKKFFRIIIKRNSQYKMKIIILCAGVSSRTQLGYPKCLYKFKDGEMLIEKNINKLKKLGFKNKDFIFATGFKSKIVKNKTKNLFRYIKNTNFKKTNMVYSLNKVIKNIKLDDILILYSDILFEKKCLYKIIKDKRDVSTVIDIDWKKKWFKKKKL